MSYNPFHYMPDDPEEERRHKEYLKKLSAEYSSTQARQKEKKREAIEALSKKYECSYEAAKLLFNNKSY